MSKQKVRLLEITLAVAVLAAAGLVIVSPLRRSQIASARQACLANLAHVGQAFQGYLNDSDQRWPYVEMLASTPTHSPPWPTLSAVLAPYLAGNRAALQCPADQRVLSDESPLRTKFPSRTTYYETEGASYQYWLAETYAGNRIGDEALSRAVGYGLGRADQPLLTDFEPFHSGDDQGPFNTLNADLKPRTTRARGGKL